MFLNALLSVTLLLKVSQGLGRYNVSDFELWSRSFAGTLNNSPVPEYVDWREKGMVSPIKNQRLCDACWAFSVIANIESQLRISINRYDILSEQFLIDCVLDQDGCSNGSVLKTFAYIVTKLGGVLRQSDYPDYQEEKRNCRWNPRSLKDTLTIPSIKGTSQVNLQALSTSIPTSPQLIPVIGFRRIKPDEDVMAYFLKKYGPLSAAINSASMKLNTNSGNIIDEPTDETCDPKHLDHSVLIVGYNTYVDRNTNAKIPYWIIKNSWGTEFGDDGYYYLVRGRNACGVKSDVSIAFVN